MPLLRTLVITPSFDVTREQLTYTSRASFDNTGLYQVLNRAQRPIYKFVLRCEPLLRVEAEYLENFHAFHQGGKSFLYDGWPYNRVENYNLVGEGETGKRQFFMPVRFVGASSYSIRTQNQVTLATSDWMASSVNGFPVSLNPTPGILTFHNTPSTVPLSGHDVLGKWSNQYRVHFDPDMWKISEFARNIYRCEFTLNETLYTSSL